MCNALCRNYAQTQHSLSHAMCRVKRAGGRAHLYLSSVTIKLTSVSNALAINSLIGFVVWHTKNKLSANCSVDTWNTRP